MVEGRVLQPPAQGTGKEVRGPEVRHETRSKATGSHVGAYRRAGNDSHISENALYQSSGTNIPPTHTHTINQ